MPGIGITYHQYDIIEDVSKGYIAETSTDPKNNVTKKVYDRVGRLTQVVVDGHPTTYTYYNNGNRESVEYPDASKEEYTYYKDNLLHKLENYRKVNGVLTLMDSYTYTYDAAHNQDTKDEVINGVSKGKTNYEYDTLNRLKTITEQGVGRTTSYTYDAAGNRETETVTNGGDVSTTIYDYNPQNRLKTVTTTVNGTTEIKTYIYDNNGNTVSVVNSVITPNTEGVQESFEVYILGTNSSKDVVINEYDVWNQLKKTTVGTNTVENTYNGEGLRIAKTLNGQTTRYLYEYDKVVLEVNAAGNQTARNIYGTNLLTRKIGSDTYYYMYNGHGDVTALLGTDGTIAGTYYYDAFGNIIEQTGSVDNPIRYAGYQYDTETGLYYLNARYYDPKIARFLQEDTYRGRANDPLSLNLYTYSLNNPIFYIDPTGHLSVRVGDKDIRDISLVDGRTYGNIRELADAFGYKYVDDGKAVTLSYEDDNGATHSRTYNKDGWMQNNGNMVVGIREITEFRGYGDTISWWHDNDGEINVTVQTQMKYAPVKVIREENNVSINAYINFTGVPNSYIPTTLKSYIGMPGSNIPPPGITYAQLATSVIENSWSGDYRVYENDLHVQTLVKTSSNDTKQKFLKFNIEEGSGRGNAGGLPAITMAILNGREGICWSMEDSVKEINVFHNTETDSLNYLKSTFAHEIGHAMGIGDAYNAGYRDDNLTTPPWAEDDGKAGYWAPEYYDEEESGNNTKVKVPDDDMMLERGDNWVNSVSSNNIRIVLEAYKGNRPVFFPWSSKWEKDRYSNNIVKYPTINK